MNQEITQLGLSERHFGVLLSPTPRGARLARRLTTAHLLAWDLPSRTIEAAEQVTAELATNAATHGRLSGRDFLLELRRTDDGRVLRIEVTDTRGDRLPGLNPQLPPPDAESGRGLLLVEVLADRWGVTQGPVPRKTVWAELDLVRPVSSLRVNMPN
ncbi:ATP-binding protein [Streptomyces camponoticapitis]|uniref:ATP-binding protein n=1 Tax=Streptomyces camponoticapitis TaxID=1616125 RepID=A0ABQ2E3X7_9ACTN|nr:ATP-binding protein [Streptomyces camponoticapitis]GGJ94239.1 ATP-binding protein [Streptomyces camponoticapitis]